MPTIHLRNYTIVLYKRPESPKWQAELRYPQEGTVRRISTRIENEHEASIFSFQPKNGGWCAFSGVGAPPFQPVGTARGGGRHGGWLGGDLPLNVGSITRRVPLHRLREFHHPRSLQQFPSTLTSVHCRI
jgi:hypothetical protein